MNEEETLPNKDLFLPIRVIYLNYIIPRNISLDELSIALDISKTYLYRTFAGKHQLNIFKMNKLAKFLNLDPEIIYTLNRVYNFVKKLFAAYPQLIHYQEKIHECIFSENPHVLSELLRLILLKEKLNIKINNE